ncbi:Protein of unknown function [Lactobacillus helveticus CIRM-BIA 953]|uniref:Uncharacterized protein n=1 Tax=Lactobacillus helveticus CIRM-BIA 953 TaxID=1226335 RepID=U4QF89_LACHE|nr:Protein of unknown function [Lactobacillus helveticus CIRM-BIA 953]
MNVGNQMAIV